MKIIAVLAFLAVFGYILYCIIKKSGNDIPNVPGVPDGPEEPQIIPGETIYNAIADECDYAVVSDIMSTYGYTFLFHEGSEMIKEDYSGIEWGYFYDYTLKKDEEVLIISESFGSSDACLDDFKRWVKQNL